MFMYIILKTCKRNRELYNSYKLLKELFNQILFQLPSFLNRFNWNIPLCNICLFIVLEQCVKGEVKFELAIISHRQEKRIL